MIPRCHLALAGYPGCSAEAAMRQATSAPPCEPCFGELGLDEVQICPQNLGVLDHDAVGRLLGTYPGTRFRLHANVRVLPQRWRNEWSSWSATLPYWQALADVSRRLQAPAYTAHAGWRSEATLETVLRAARVAGDQFGCPVGIEGHYPTAGDPFLVSTWPEYRQLFESGVGYALDLSHLHILVSRSRDRQDSLVAEMLACDRCLEVHVSANDGCRDQHRVVAEPPWWWELLRYVHPGAVVFSEGQQKQQ